MALRWVKSKDARQFIFTAGCHANACNNDNNPVWIEFVLVRSRIL